MSAPTIVFNTIERKVFKPITGNKRLFPNLPAFDEYGILHWVCQAEAIKNGASGTLDFVKHIFDDAGLILAIFASLEARCNRSGDKLAISSGLDMVLDDFGFTDMEGPQPSTQLQGLDGVIPYLYSSWWLTGMNLPIIEDDELYPRIEFSNVFGGDDANAAWEIYVHYIKTK